MVISMRYSGFLAIAIIALSFISCSDKRLEEGGGSGDQTTAVLDTVGATLSPWQKGQMDIHFINTTAGECTFLIFPDGTQMLVDAAGARTRTQSGSVCNVGIRERWDPFKNGTSFNFGEFIAGYIDKCMAWTGNGKFDYALLTHFHNDHFGGTTDMAASTNSSTYVQQSFPYLLDRFGADVLLDRGYPDYDYPFDMLDATKNTSNSGNCRNYVNAVKWHVANKGMKAAMFKAGADDQIVLTKEPAKYPEFSVRNLAVCGEIWTGSGTSTRKTFPDKSEITGDGSLSSDNCPNENATSIAFKVSYGKFDLFMGGDLSYVGMSDHSWKDPETPIAKVCGEVEVMKGDHHGCHNTNGYNVSKGAIAMKYLKPQVWVLNTWADTQPYAETITNAATALPKLNIFVSNIVESRLSELGVQIAGKFKGKNGHIVVRVFEGGDEYGVYMLSDYDGLMTVQTAVGPYKSN